MDLRGNEKICCSFPLKIKIKENKRKWRWRQRCSSAAVQWQLFVIRRKHKMLLSNLWQLCSYRHFPETDSGCSIWQSERSILMGVSMRWVTRAWKSCHFRASSPTHPMPRGQKFPCWEYQIYHAPSDRLWNSLSRLFSCLNASNWGQLSIFELTAHRSKSK